MKKILLTTLILSFILISPTTAIAGESDTNIISVLLPYIINTTTKYANISGANIYKEPNKNSEILGTTQLNTSFEVILENNEWSMITTQDSYAFIESKNLSTTEIRLKYLGTFKITHYCCENYKHICGTGDGKTATGINVHPGIVAVDPKVIPLKSTVMIDNVEYKAEDTGSAIKGNRIDIAVATHKEALKLGIYYADVYVK